MTTSFVVHWRSLSRRLLLPLALLCGAPAAFAQVSLADQPLFSTIQVPGNLIFTLSVEFPTASVSAYYAATTYAPTTQYVGYFDPAKCYSYNAVNSGTTAAPNYTGSYFVPYGLATNATCSSATTPLWSGNYLNWAGMLSLDEFRWVLTGGSRLIDTTSQTVLQRTYQSGQDNGGDAPNKSVLSSTLLAGATPFNWSSASTRIWGLGSALAITGTGSLSGTPPTVVAYTGQNSQSSPAASQGSVYLLYLNVQVCSPTVSLEANCVAYGSNYKPEGLMQKYSSQLRYSAISYLNDANVLRDGGVMRAALKFIGPTQPVPGSANIANSLAEWSSSTGIMVTNPNPSDATSTTSAAAAAGGSAQITNSGVINYLNLFGYSASSYKTHDPVSELYYAAIRYLKNLAPVPEYSSLTATGTSATAIKAWLDGFPVVTSYPDPILYTCQKNFIIGIGDEHTWQDANLPGSVLIPSTYEPTEPSTVVADTSVNVTTATNMIGQLEGTGNIGNGYFAGGATKATYDLAGLAYDSHTVNMRPDLSTTANPVSVTASTYWLDVLEQPGYQSRNQYYYATKYGGFTVPSGFVPYATSNGTSTLPLTSWYNSTNTLTGTSGVVDKQPDNFFTANNAVAMQTSLNAAFSKIIAENTSANSTAFSAPTPNVTSSGSISYSATYDPTTWTGVVLGSSVVYGADGTPTLTQQWDARALLSASTTTATTRKIITCCTTSVVSGALGLPFTSTALSGNTLIARTSSYSTTFDAVPGASSQSTSNFISYLRGDTTQEIANGGAYRTRAYRLGDIVNSKPIVVAAPAFPFYEIYNSGYTVFKNTYASRNPVVYVGSNDGMLHAFDGTVNASTSGSELFGYIPSFVYGTSGSTGTAATTGLPSLGNPSFIHHYFVDSTPVQADVDFGNTQGASSTTPNWHTILIGGLGKGGTGYYAIDVTDPTTFTSEANLATKVLWEFTDSDMGYTYGPPSVVKTKKYGWVVVVPSGYNNASGVGHFYFINPRTGALLDEVNTSTGSTGAPVNLAQLSAFVPNYTDMTADTVYAGDLAGDVWRVDVTGTSANYSTTKATLFATLADASGNAQPVTTRPLIEIDPTTNSRYLLVGTGRLLADSDISSTLQQTFYAIKDGTGAAGGFYTSSTLPTGVAFPVVRADLVANTNLLVGITSSPTKLMGWYFDMPASGIAQRVNIDPVANSGEIVWAGNQPNGSACSPEGTGTLYGVSFASGKTALVNSSGAYTATYTFPSTSTGSTSITDLDILRVNGVLRLYAGDAAGTVSLVPTSVSTSVGLKQLNWRDIPVTN